MCVFISWGNDPFITCILPIHEHYCGYLDLWLGFWHIYTSYTFLSLHVNTVYLELYKLKRSLLFQLLIVYCQYQGIWLGSVQWHNGSKLLPVAPPSHALCKYSANPQMPGEDTKFMLITLNLPVPVCVPQPWILCQKPSKFHMQAHTKASSTFRQYMLWEKYNMKNLLHANVLFFFPQTNKFTVSYSSLHQLSKKKAL